MGQPLRRGLEARVAHALEAALVDEREAGVVLLGHRLGADVEAAPQRPQLARACPARSRAGPSRAARRGRRARSPRCRAAGRRRWPAPARPRPARRGRRGSSAPGPGRCPRRWCRGRSRSPGSPRSSRMLMRSPSWLRSVKSGARRLGGHHGALEAAARARRLGVALAAARGEHDRPEREDGDEEQADEHPRVHAVCRLEGAQLGPLSCFGADMGPHSRTVDEKVAWLAGRAHVGSVMLTSGAAARGDNPTERRVERFRTRRPVAEWSAPLGAGSQ